MRVVDPTAWRRFVAKVDWNHPSGCWIWVGSRRHAYGEFWHCGKKVYPHRFAYQLFVDPALDGLDVVCHACDTPLCVNPSHLWVGTQADNLRDMRDKGRARGMWEPGCVHPWRARREAA